MSNAALYINFIINWVNNLITWYLSLIKTCKCSHTYWSTCRRASTRSSTSSWTATTGWRTSRCSLGCAPAVRRRRRRRRSWRPATAATANRRAVTCPSKPSCPTVRMMSHRAQEVAVTTTASPLPRYQSPTPALSPPPFKDIHLSICLSLIIIIII